LSSVPEPRPLLRRRLLAERAAFADRPDGLDAKAALARHLQILVTQLEPTCLGVYWPVRSEFNAPLALAQDANPAALSMALPFVRKNPPHMHYRAWNGQPPTQVDEARIPASDGTEVTPDVVLVPCVGFTAAGYRLGYGGGYFDRWIAAHPQVTTVGIAWAFSELRGAEFEAQAHDRLLSLVLTENGIVEP
jgi:5-formyltetrahydrofolate cyclo-ligase